MQRRWGDIIAAAGQAGAGWSWGKDRPLPKSLGAAVAVGVRFWPLVGQCLCSRWFPAACVMPSFARAWAGMIRTRLVITIALSANRGITGPPGVYFVLREPRAHACPPPAAADGCTASTTQAPLGDFAPSALWTFQAGQGKTRDMTAGQHDASASAVGYLYQEIGRAHV